MAQQESRLARLESFIAGARRGREGDTTLAHIHREVGDALTAQGIARALEWSWLGGWRANLLLRQNGYERNRQDLQIESLPDEAA